jgi:hypothetical protein
VFRPPCAHSDSHNHHHTIRSGGGGSSSSGWSRREQQQEARGEEQICPQRARDAPDPDLRSGGCAPQEQHTSICLAGLHLLQPLLHVHSLPAGPLRCCQVPGCRGVCCVWRGAQSTVKRTAQCVDRGGHHSSRQGCTVQGTDGGPHEAAQPWYVCGSCCYVGGCV